MPTLIPRQAAELLQLIARQAAKFIAKGALVCMLSGFIEKSSKSDVSKKKKRKKKDALSSDPYVLKKF
jgi:hypothetical protein